MAINKNFYNPYTFIPLSDKVITYSEKEVEKINYSHDIPLSNTASSGFIEFTMEAKTPFCIKSDNGRSSQIVDKYFVPGTSIKGMIKNVFEIITFSNIKNVIADSRYSMRDIRSDDYKLKSKDSKHLSGFLVQLNHQLFIVQCSSDKYLYEEIEDIEGVDLKRVSSISTKYSKLNDEYIFEDNNIYRMWFFSGYMNNKKHEFLFDIPNDFINEKFYPLDKREYDDFIFIHEKENDNEAWKFWKKRLKNYINKEDIAKDMYKGIVPCFFRLKKRNDDLIVKDLGFSFLYRQPYDKSIHDCLPESHKSLSDDQLDMTKAVFGYTSTKNSLRGRVAFSNSFLKNAAVDIEQTFIMGKPKPTYYPFYLAQKDNKKLITFFQQNVKISGWKRNLVHIEAKTGISTGKPNIETSFIPIKAGAQFTCKVRYHNLSDFELGALISAITFHNSVECYHLLGYAKPFGYGKFKLLNIKLYDSLDKTEDNLLEAFEMYIEEKIDKKQWIHTLNSLRYVAKGEYSGNKEIRYPTLNKKEFEEIKKSKLNLKDFSPLS